MIKQHPKAALRNVQMRTFQCDECGQVIDAPKYRGRTHIGHVKDMYCYRCQRETKHTQIG